MWALDQNKPENYKVARRSKRLKGPTPSGPTRSTRSPRLPWDCRWGFILSLPSEPPPPIHTASKGAKHPKVVISREGFWMQRQRLTLGCLRQLSSTAPTPPHEDQNLENPLLGLPSFWMYDIYLKYLDYGDGFIGIYICQDVTNCRL